MNVYKRSLLFGLLWFMSICAAHAVPSGDTNDNTESIENTESVDLITDDYVTVIENYPSLIVDFLNVDLLLNQPEDSKLPVYNFDFRNLFGFKKLAFLYAIRLNKSRFALCLGLGYSNIAYAFSKKDNGGTYTLAKDDRGWETLSESDGQSLWGESNIVVDRSTFKASYFDVLFRVRFNTLLDEPKGGVFMWLGTKFGYLYSTCTNIAYHTKSGHKNRALCCSGNFNNMDKISWFGEAGLGYKRFGINVGYNFRAIFMKSNVASIRPLYVSFSTDLF